MNYSVCDEYPNESFCKKWNIQLYFVTVETFYTHNISTRYEYFLCEIIKIYLKYVFIISMLS